MRWPAWAVRGACDSAARRRSVTLPPRSIEGLAFAKYSSAYLPPEAVVFLADGTCIVRSFFEDEASGVAVPLLGLSYSLLRADPAHDMWAFGALLYPPPSLRPSPPRSRAGGADTTR